MPFSKAPSQSTYQTKDLRTAWALRNRDTSVTTDTIALNGFFDIVKEKALEDKDLHFVKRDGVTKITYSLPSGPARGAYYWEDEDKLFVAYDAHIAVIQGATGAFISTLSSVFATTSGDVGFSEFLYDTGTTKVVATDGTKIVTIDSANTVVAGTSPDQPASFDPFITFIDGYLFLTKSSTSDIYNSNLNDPLLYTAGDFISAEMVPDELRRIGRLNNYIVAFGTASIEYFYDAANASGSPLNRVDTPVKNIGFLGGLVAHKNKMYFVGQTDNTTPEVFVLEDWKIDSLDNPPLRRVNQPNNEYHGAIVTNGGHDFYVLTSGGVTYWMDLETNVWTRLGFQSTEKFDIREAFNISRTTEGNVSVLIPASGTDLYYFNPNVYQDDLVNFLVVVQTYKQTFDTFHRKFMSRLMAVADKASAGTINVSWTDDDYQTFTTPRTMDLTITRPTLHRMGEFVERAFKVTMLDNKRLKLHHFEVDFNIGNR
jgi:hypothetical protein